MLGAHFKCPVLRRSSSNHRSINKLHETAVPLRGLFKGNYVIWMEWRSGGTHLPWLQPNGRHNWVYWYWWAARHHWRIKTWACCVQRWRRAGVSGGRERMAWSAGEDWRRGCGSHRYVTLYTNIALMLLATAGEDSLFLDHPPAPSAAHEHSSCASSPVMSRSIICVGSKLRNVLTKRIYYFVWMRHWTGRGKKKKLSTPGSGYK